MPGITGSKAWIPICCIVVLLSCVGLLFATSPRQGDFWWSDAPRHAMDGVFIHDLIRDHPIRNPEQYAMDYYIRYPALTILFYPPGFALVEALFFAIFGVSHSSAMIAIAACYAATALGGYFLLKRRLPPVVSAASVLVFIALPETALWGRQVMLEIPACAAMMWAAWAFLRFQDTQRSRYLYASVFFLASAMYMKQTAGFVGVVFVATAWLRRRTIPLPGRALLIKAGVLFAVLALPVVAMTLRFGRINVDSVVGGEWNKTSLWSWESLTFYLRQLPDQAGWPVVILATGYVVAAMWRRSWRLEDLDFFLLWAAVGYVAFTAVALKEPRHTVLVLFPIAVFAIQAVCHLFPRPLHNAGVSLLAAVTLAGTLLWHPVPAVSGYQEAAELIAAKAPRNSAILFMGQRDGSFTFNVRARSHRPDISVIRADKLLLRVTQRRELGIVDRGIPADQIATMLNEYGITYAVSEPGFWDDLKSVNELDSVLKGRFAKVAEIKVQANIDHKDRQLNVYRNLTDVSVSSRRQIRIELPLINAVVEGEVGKNTPLQ
jgi:hypothetical protein